MPRRLSSSSRPGQGLESADAHGPRLEAHAISAAAIGRLLRELDGGAGEGTDVGEGGTDRGGRFCHQSPP